MSKQQQAPAGLRTAQLSAEEICRLGQEIYDRELKDRLEPQHNGEFVVINVANGDYVVDADEVRALEQALARYPDEVFFTARIGSPYVDRLGSSGQR
jgi:hypothetical protein